MGCKSERRLGASAKIQSVYETAIARIDPKSDDSLSQLIAPAAEYGFGSLDAPYPHFPRTFRKRTESLSVESRTIDAC